MLASYFDRNRGLAMGLALAGVGLGTAVMPVLSNVLIGHFGWRLGYVGLGAVVVILAFIPVALLLPEPAVKQAPTNQPATLPGLTLAEAIRTWKYWRSTIAFFFAATTINGSLVHVVPLLTDRGIPVGAAVSTIAAAGMALIVGRVIAGYIMDRVLAPYVALVFLGGPILGLAILGLNVQFVGPVVGTILLGLGIGGEIDLMSFLITRYFGIRAFGAMHGLMFSVFVLEMPRVRERWDGRSSFFEVLWPGFRGFRGAASDCMHLVRDIGTLSISGQSNGRVICSLLCRHDIRLHSDES